MKKLVAKAAGGRQVVINLFETPVPWMDPVRGRVQGASPKGEGIRCRSGSYGDRDLASSRRRGSGRECNRLLEGGQTDGDRERELEKRVVETGDEQKYEQKGRTRNRLEEKVKELRREKGLPKARYSANYFRKFIRFASIWAKSRLPDKCPTRCSTSFYMTILLPPTVTLFSRNANAGKFAPPVAYVQLSGTC